MAAILSLFRREGKSCLAVGAKMITLGCFGASAVCFLLYLLLRRKYEPGEKLSGLASLMFIAALFLWLITVVLLNFFNI